MIYSASQYHCLFHRGRARSTDIGNQDGNPVCPQKPPLVFPLGVFTACSLLSGEVIINRNFAGLWNVPIRIVLTCPKTLMNTVERCLVEVGSIKLSFESIAAQEFVFSEMKSYPQSYPQFVLWALFRGRGG